MTRKLTEIEFRNTFGNKMLDVTETAEAVVDIWDYVKDLVALKLVDNYVYENNLIEIVYRNENSTFDHILLPTNNQNNFVAVVVDLINASILGHIKLDLNQLYKLKD